jgi:hypothetical protein
MFLTETQGLPSRENYDGLDDVGRLLMDAANAIERQGLPCTAIDAKGRTCVIVTMGRLSGDCDLVDRAIDRLRPHVGYVARWSDDHGLAGLGSEVVAKLRAVALGGK